MEVLREGKADKTMRVHVMQGKTEKFLKIVLDLTLVMQNTIFTIGLTREKVAKLSYQNPLNKILKILSKCFSQLEGPLVSKSRRESRILLCKLTTRASTHKQITKLSRENAKNLEILKIFQVFFATRGLTSQRVMRML